MRHDLNNRQGDAKPFTVRAKVQPYLEELGV